MNNSQARVRPYLRIIDNLSTQLSELKEILNDPEHHLIDSDSRFQVGGQLAALAEEFGNLAEEIEHQPE